MVGCCPRWEGVYDAPGVRYDGGRVSAALRSLAAVYVAVAALGAAIIGIQAFLPVSMIGLPGEWATPAILGVVAATLAVSGGLFWLGDHLVYRMIGSPARRHVVAKPEVCFLCGGDLLRRARTCPTCGALVRDRWKR